MKNNKDESTMTADELLKDLRKLVAEAEAMIADAATSHATDAVESLRARFATARERAADMYDETREKVVAGARRADESIRENPYPALGIAAGVGVLVGVLLGRGCK